MPISACRTLSSGRFSNTFILHSSCPTSCHSPLNLGACQNAKLYLISFIFLLSGDLSTNTHLRTFSIILPSLVSTSSRVTPVEIEPIRRSLTFQRASRVHAHSARAFTSTTDIPAKRPPSSACRTDGNCDDDGSVRDIVRACGGPRGGAHAAMLGVRRGAGARELRICAARSARPRAHAGHRRRPRNGGPRPC